MERLYQAVERIADALEKQNRQNKAWMKMQRCWYEENVRREEGWRAEQRARMIEQRMQERTMYELALQHAAKEGESDTTSASDSRHQ